MALHDPVRVTIPGTMVLRLERVGSDPVRVGDLVVTAGANPGPVGLYCVLPDNLGGPVLIDGNASTLPWSTAHKWFEWDRVVRVRRALRIQVDGLTALASAESKAAARIPAEAERAGDVKPAAIAERVNLALARAEEFLDRANACREAFETLNRAGLPPDEP